MRRPDPLKGASQTRAHSGVSPTLPKRSGSPVRLCWQVCRLRASSPWVCFHTPSAHMRKDQCIRAHVCAGERGGQSRRRHAGGRARVHARVHGGDSGAGSLGAAGKPPSPQPEAPSTPTALPYERRFLGGVFSSVSVVCHFYLGKAAPPVTPPFPFPPPPATCPFSLPTAGAWWLLPLLWHGPDRA